MLQPRRCRATPSPTRIWIYLVLAITLFSQSAQTDDSQNSKTSREDTVSANGEVVLDNNAETVSNDDDNEAYLNANKLNKKLVPPVIGLVSTTARTFIDNGVTTQYGTAVYGTEIKNGEYYVQFLTTNTKILYDNQLATKTVEESENIFNIDKDFDEKKIHTILIQPKSPLPAYLQRTKTPELELKEEQIVTSVVSSSSSSSSSNSGKKAEALIAKPGSEETIKSGKSLNLSEEEKLFRFNEILPTFTVAQEGLLYETKTPSLASSQSRSNKAINFALNTNNNFFVGSDFNEADDGKLDNEAIVNELKSTTYYGFSEFTTIVGDTQIVFLPNTQSGDGGINANVINIEPTVTWTSEVKTLDASLNTRLPFKFQKPVKVGSEKTTSSTSSSTTSETTTTTTTTTTTSTTTEEPKEELSNEALLEQEILSQTETPQVEEQTKSVEENEIFPPEEPSLPPPVEEKKPFNITKILHTPTNEEILKIFNSIKMEQLERESKVKEEIEKSKVDQLQTDAVEIDPSPASKEVNSGVTTIFFDPDFEDPFAILEREELEKKDQQDEKKSTEEEADEEKTTVASLTTLTENEEDNTPEIESSTTIKPAETKEQLDEKESTTDEAPSTDTTEAAEQPLRELTTSMENPTDATKPQTEGDDLAEQCRNLIITTTIPTYKTLTLLTTYFIPKTNADENAAGNTEKGAEIEERVESNYITSTEFNKLTITPAKYLDLGCAATTVPTLQTFTTVEEEEKEEEPEEVTEPIKPATISYKTISREPQQQQESTTEDVVEKIQEPETPEEDEEEEITTEKFKKKAYSVIERPKSSTERTDPEISGEGHIDQRFEPEDDQETTSERSNDLIEIVTEKKHVTSADDTEEGQEEETTTLASNEENADNYIWKTLYTTYTYLTTFFHESTSSVSSRKEIVTNIIKTTMPSGVQIGLETIDPSPTENVGIGRPTLLNFDQFDAIFGENGPDDEDIAEELIEGDGGVKTLYTTYTYFTTIFVDGETEVSSRTEVFTNYITPTKVQNIEMSTRTADAEERMDEGEQTEEEKLLMENRVGKSYMTMVRSSGGNDEPEDLIEKHSNDTEFKQRITKMVTNTQNSTSHVDNIVEMVDVGKSNDHLIDQMESESKNLIKRIDHDIDNHEEINPTALKLEQSDPNEDINKTTTLLLQTSYTTFTYFTTMYVGTESSNVLSRLETITNIVTETLKGTDAEMKTRINEIDGSIATADDAKEEFDKDLPVTYFTTFTYWTTIFKDGTTVTTSREETISNVIAPTSSSSIVSNLMTTEARNLKVQPLAGTDSILTDIEIKSTTEAEAQIPVVEGSEPVDGNKISPSSATTYYTTYTYYTTSYVGDETVINSHFETLTNVHTEGISPSSTTAKGEVSSRALNFQETIEDVKNELTDKKANLDSRFGTEDDSTPPLDQFVNTANLLRINYGRIVDSENISTIHYKTLTLATTIDNIQAEVLQSTRSIQVDEKRKNELATQKDGKDNNSPKTGLVRSIDGTIINRNSTDLVTHYQSKIIGTVIEGRYAQIIESRTDILTPTVTNKADLVLKTEEVTKVQKETAKVEQSSAPADGTELEENEEEGEDGEDDGDDDGRGKSRLTFQTRKRTFTPIIRPFVVRTRPTFNPKRKPVNTNTGPQTVTRTDLTPTFTVTAALTNTPSNLRTRLRSTNSKFNYRTSTSAQNVINSSTRGRFQGSRSTNTLQLSSTRTRSNPIRSTGTGGIRSTLLSPTSRVNRFRSSSQLGISSTRTEQIYKTKSFEPVKSEEPTENKPQEEGGDDNEQATEEVVEVKTTTARNNPLLGRFKRPLTRLGTGPRLSTTTTTTTTTPKPKRTFKRPPSLNFQQTSGNSIGSAVSPSERFNRNRGNSLFPPRGFLKPTTSTTEAPAEEEGEEDFVDDGEEEVLSRKKRQLYHSKLKPTPFVTNNNRKRYDQEEEVIEYIDYYDSPTTTTKRPTSRKSNFRSRASYSPPHNQQNSGTTNRPTTLRASNIRASNAQNFRQQFTLRENPTFKQTTTYSPPTTTTRRRPPLGGSRANRVSTTKKAGTTRGRARNPTYLKPTYSRNTGTTSRASNPRTTTNPRSRSRPNGNIGASNVDQQYIDSTAITVTHHFPQEVTIPYENPGSPHRTDYKTVVTQKTSTEVIPRKSLRTYENTIFLNTESTLVNPLNGITELVQFYLKETETTTIIFTPTTIRGRRTSFSHIVPSTVYNVEMTTVTQVPSLVDSITNPAAPLANILLSQLLLGNLNGGGNNNNLGLPGLNPLIPNQMAVIDNKPQTEYKTRTTTYVTTLTDQKSTVLPLTFHGKEILTTIYDNSQSVITATEYITDTIVLQPTAQINAIQQTQPQGINNLLLPLLLQQQQQQQALPQIGLLPKEELVPEEIENVLAEQPARVPPSRGRPNKEPPVIKKQIAPQNTEIITLYVSGRKPGEFSTILSTVISGGDDGDYYRRRRRSEEYHSYDLLSPEVELEATENIPMNRIKTRALDDLVQIDHTKTILFGVVEPDKPGQPRKIYQTAMAGGRLALPKTSNSSSSSSSNANFALAPTSTDKRLRQRQTKFVANNFITKTCVTTFTYLTNIHVVNGSTSYESHEQVIKNVATERYVAPDGLAADQILLDFHSTVIEPSEPQHQHQTEIQSTIFAVEKTPALSVATLYTTYSYLNEIVSSQDENEIVSEKEEDDFGIQLNATETTKVIMNMITVPMLEGSDSDEVTTTAVELEPTTVFNTYFSPLESSLTLKQIVKTVINQNPEAELEDEIDTSPVQTEAPIVSSSAPAIIENFKKLAPVVLNAMADLLQKLPGKANKIKEPIDREDLLVAEESAPIPSIQEKPIYIPVSADDESLDEINEALPLTAAAGVNIQSKNGGQFNQKQSDSATSESEVKFQLLDHNHFTPPQLSVTPPNINGDDGHNLELNLMDLKLAGGPSRYTSNQNTNTNAGVGIPISPGEVITTNSDVIIGRPAVLGSGPRLPNSMVKSIPVHQQQHQDHGITAQSSNIRENYHNNVNAIPDHRPIPFDLSPPSAPQFIRNEQSNFHHPPPPPPPENKPLNRNQFSQNAIPLSNPAIDIQLQSSPNPHPNFNRDIPPNKQLHRPHLIHHPPQLKAHHPHHQQQQQRPPPNFVQRPQIPITGPASQPQFNRNQPHPHHHFNQNQNQHSIPTPPLINHAAMIKVAENSNLGNDIIEIQKIPEVYSTDLPPVLVHGNAPMNIQVDLQPSQVTNVIIPSNSGQFSIVHPVQQPPIIINNRDPSKKFVYGKYFSEPSPYHGAEKFLEFYTKKPQLVVMGDNQQNQINPPTQYNISYRPDSTNEISLNASPIKFQQTPAFAEHPKPQIYNQNLFIQQDSQNEDDEDDEQPSKDEPIVISTSNKVASVQSLDGKAEIQLNQNEIRIEDKNITKLKFHPNQSLLPPHENKFPNEQHFGGLKEHGSQGFNIQLNNQIQFQSQSQPQPQGQFQGVSTVESVPSPGQVFSGNVFKHYNQNQQPYQKPYQLQSLGQQQPFNNQPQFNQFNQQNRDNQQFQVNQPQFNPQINQQKNQAQHQNYNEGSKQQGSVIHQNQQQNQHKHQQQNQPQQHHQQKPNPYLQIKQQLANEQVNQQQIRQDQNHKQPNNPHHKNPNPQQFAYQYQNKQNVEPISSPQPPQINIPQRRPPQQPRPLKGHTYGTGAQKPETMNMNKPEYRPTANSESKNERIASNGQGLNTNTPNVPNQNKFPNPNSTRGPFKHPNQHNKPMFLNKERDRIRIRTRPQMVSALKPSPISPIVDNYNHQSYGQNPPPPPSMNEPGQYQSHNSNQENIHIPTPPTLNRVPDKGTPITLQTQVKQVVHGSNANEINQSFMIDMVPPPVATLETTTKPQFIQTTTTTQRPHFYSKGPTPSASPQGINNEFLQMMKDSVADGQENVPFKSPDVPTNNQIVVQSDNNDPSIETQTEYNGLQNMSKYHHFEREPIFKAPKIPPIHQNSMKISRVPPPVQRPPLQNTTFAGAVSGYDKTPAASTVHNTSTNIIASNQKPNSRGTSKYQYNLNHKPYQFQQHQNRQKPATESTTTTTSTLAPPHPRPPMKYFKGGSPFHIPNVHITTTPKGPRNGPFKDKYEPPQTTLNLDLTPPPLRQNEVIYEHSFNMHKPPEVSTQPAIPIRNYQAIERDRSQYNTVTPRPFNDKTTVKPKETNYWELHRDKPPVNRVPGIPFRNREHSESTTLTPTTTTTRSDPPTTTGFTTTHIPETTTERDIIITAEDDADATVLINQSWGPSYTLDNGPKIILTNKPEDEEDDDIIKEDHELFAVRESANPIHTQRPNIDLVVIQAPRTTPTTSAPETSTVTEEPTTFFTTTTTNRIETTTTSEPTTTESRRETTEYRRETTYSPTESTTDEITTTTLRSYLKSVRLRTKFGHVTTTHKPVLILKNNTFKIGHRPNTPFLRPSVSVVDLNPSTTSTTEAPPLKPMKKTEADSIFVVMRPSNPQPTVPDLSQHRNVLITKKPETKKHPIDFHPVSRDEEEVEAKPDNRLLIAGIHHNQDHTFNKPDKTQVLHKDHGHFGTSAGEYEILSDNTTVPYIPGEGPEIGTGDGTSGPEDDEESEIVHVCEPECNTAKNEKCVLWSDDPNGDESAVKYTKCVCRPGFARMFPDRPCKPTYTYTVHMKLNRYGAKQLIYDDALHEPSSKKFEFLRHLTKNSLDRMLMQSDVRDIYHGIKQINFHPMRQSEPKSPGSVLNKGGIYENMEIYDNGLVTEFNLQLSENTEADRLGEIFVKYLRKNSYKIGNTELTTFPIGTVGNPAPLLNVTDFDECQSEKDNDCSKNASCFNLKGSYTCSCKENYADVSEMSSIYPGRKCTNDRIGCAPCSFNGRCGKESSCECFRWYFGSSCQYNLKVILYGIVLLFVIVLVFLFLLFFCILIKRNRHDQRRSFDQHLIQGMIVKPALSVNEFQRRSVHDDPDEVSSNTTNSTQASQQQLRANKVAASSSKSQFDKRRNPVFYYPQNTGQSTKSNKSARGSMERKSVQEPITVMIPRAKFQSSSQSDLTKKEIVSPISNNSSNNNNKKKTVQDKNSVTSMSCYSSQIEAKLLSYLDNSAPVPERKKSEQKKSHNYQPTGALVSAGFEVSATVGMTSNQQRIESNKKMEMELEEEDLLMLNDSISVKAANRRYNEMQNRDTSDWFRDDHENDDRNMGTLTHPHLSTTYRTVSEARSYDETTIHPATKTLRSNGNMDEANTMAERDIGSTYLLPHTHLYKPPDRCSDISGFDSL